MAPSCTNSIFENRASTGCSTFDDHTWRTTVRTPATPPGQATLTGPQHHVTSVRSHSMYGHHDPCARRMVLSGSEHTCDHTRELGQRYSQDVRHGPRMLGSQYSSSRNPPLPRQLCQTRFQGRESSRRRMYRLRCPRRFA